ncbi:unnamed protein product [Phytophthora fragariaefolia]|uniref:Unnamed protein product n=1 Tax=Phytophthora fragariaefolia TaxID=1490495 RepID=A0A9W6X5F1_9STRA|nr:unnamed protein product [Phytophthora fragariaefolia]
MLQANRVQAKDTGVRMVSGEHCDTVLTPIIESFDAELLNTFCDLRLVKDVLDVTDGILIAIIDHIAGSVKSDTLPDIKDLFKSKLRLNITEDDVDSWVLEREKCKRLVVSLHPATLKDEVRRCVKYLHKPAATDTRLLFQLVEKATEHERQFQRLKAAKRDQNECGQAKPKRDRPTDKRSVKTNPFKSRAEDSSRTTVSSGGATSASNQKAASKLPHKPCPKCKEMHWIRDCPKVTTDEEREELRQLLRGQTKAQRACLKRLSDLLPDCSREVTVNGVLKLPYCPDSSDYTVSCRSRWERLREKDPSVRAEQLENPVKNQTYGSNWVMADKKATLYLLVHTAAGPVRPTRAVDVLIADIDDDEFIVGNDLLRSLGIDVGRQLEMLANRSDDETSGDTVELKADDPLVGNAESSGDANCAAVERMLARAVENGFLVDKLEKLRTIVHAYDVWRFELRGDPPAKVPPLEVRLQEGARPVKCEPREYPPHIRQFIREFNSRLVELGLVYENPNRRWASPGLPVKKSADLMDLRQTTNYRPVNDLTDVRAAAIPVLSVVVENARGMNHFGLFDYLKGFWQLPLTELCQEFLSYMTDEKFFPVVARLSYFRSLDQFGLKLSAKKSSLYQTQVKWCSKVINDQGIHHDAKRIESLQAVPYPQIAAELQKFVCAINWMRDSIIDFARQVEPLQRRLDLALASTKRTRRAAATIQIELYELERQAFDQVKEGLANSATLNFPDDQATTCLFNDASDLGYCNWTVIEKEAFPIVMACDKLDYLLQRPTPFRMYCDHRNLINVFVPHESVKKHVKGKLLRWAMKLMNCRYVIEHVPGDANVWENMISRWSGNHIPTVNRLKAFRVAPAVEHQPVSAPTHLMTSILSGLPWMSSVKSRPSTHHHQTPLATRTAFGCVRTVYGFLLKLLNFPNAYASWLIAVPKATVASMQ